MIAATAGRASQDRGRALARGTMDILEHSRIAVTPEIYIGADDASRREAIDRSTGCRKGGQREPLLSLLLSPDEKARLLTGR